MTLLAGIPLSNLPELPAAMRRELVGAECCRCRQPLKIYKPSMLRLRPFAERFDVPQAICPECVEIKPRLKPLPTWELEGGQS